MGQSQKMDQSQKMGQSQHLFVYFCSFHIPIQGTNIQFELYELKNSVDGVLGSRTQGGRMEGADKSTELWRHPINVDKTGD